MNSWTEKPKVLIVDDDADFISDMKVLLSSEFDIKSAGGTRQAWEMLEEDRPHCMLLDLNMPEYFGDNPDDEGFSFLRHVSEKSSHRPDENIPVIILTAHHRNDSSELAKKCGVSTFYHKPPDIKRLKTSIWNLIDSVNRNST